MKLILHHYDISPYAEKIRLVFGLKQLAWQSVQQPMVMPKPGLVALTGGYRRIPVLQIGSDIVCDTNLIAAVLESLHPSPTAYPQGRRAESEIWCNWAERVLMWPTARYVVAVNNDKLGPGFHADRAAMRGHPPGSPAEIEASIPYNREQCLIMLRWLESIFSDGRAFLLGTEAGLADFAVYQRVWWLGGLGGRAQDVLAGLTRLQGWLGRVEAIGHGQRTDISAAQALRIAGDTPSDPRIAIGAPASVPSLGDRIRIGTEGHAPDAVEGIVRASTSELIAIEPQRPEGPKVVVYLPRFGYEWRLVS